MTKTALITGANKGIGFETARLLGERGFTVLIGARNPASGVPAQQTLQERGIDARFIALDITDDEVIRQAADRVAADFGRLDVLVNNAGIAATAEGGGAAPSATTRAALREIFETNVFGLVAVTNAVLPLLRKAEAARIVNVSSEVGSLSSMSDPGNPLYPIAGIPYPTSKTAVNMITVMYAKELRDTAIKVNASDPGHCATDLTRRTGVRTAEQGALVAVRLATLPADGPSGLLFSDGSPGPDQPRAW